MPVDHGAHRGRDFLSEPPTLDLLREGYEVYPVADAIGGISGAAQGSAMQRMVSAGAQPVTVISLVSEL